MKFNAIQVENNNACHVFSDPKTDSEQIWISAKGKLENLHKFQK